MYPFTDIKRYPNPEVLSDREIEVVLEVLGRVLELFLCDREAAGTLVLDGQRYIKKWQTYDSACPILQTNLQAGSFQLPADFSPGLATVWTSENLAATSIHEILVPAGYSPYLKRYPGLAKAKNGDQIQTGIYRAEGLKVLVLNATHGRFLASFYVNPDNAFDRSGGEFSTAVLCAVASILRLLSARPIKEDAVLTRGTDDLLQNASDDLVVLGHCREAAMEARSAFSPNLKIANSVIAWRSEICKGDGRLFFEP